MLRRNLPAMVALSFLLFCCAFSATASQSKEKNGKTAIVVASFGTTVPSAVESITNIVDAVRTAFPNTEVRVSFTSNIIRSVWKKRQNEADKWLAQGVSEEILYVKNIISTLGDLQDEGYKRIIVQPTHMFFMEQSQDLAAYINALASIETTKKKWQPFEVLVMGRPALGMPGDQYNYHEDVAEAVKTLEKDVKLAEEQGASLVYMGHGNEHWSTGIYATVEKAINDAFPQIKTVIGVVEGHPTFEDVLAKLNAGDKKKVVLKPFMIVAGDHAENDMAGDEPDSWKNILTAAGYEVVPVLEGLGSNDAFAHIFVEHIKDAARDNGLELQ
jgi:sirohydrochlorin cobaltochelatase